MLNSIAKQKITVHLLILITCLVAGNFFSLLSAQTIIPARHKSVSIHVADASEKPATRFRIITGSTYLQKAFDA
ncbi:MAG TPA: hypothetical protein VGN64_19520, partial [Dyadobacter sp.]|nr:hypothetical protein [Dyadobacter sp.]